ncbi:hypothetical protein UlMin_040948 [Ulmus minor]
MPVLSSTMIEGKIISWIKFEGDVLTKGERVIMVEFDKEDMDVETFYDGYLAAIMVEGGVATVGSEIALLAETKAEIAEAKPKSNSSSSAAATALAGQSTSEKVAKNVGSVLAPPLKAPGAAVLVSFMHPTSEEGKGIVATSYAKKLATELNVDLGRIVGSRLLGRIMVKDVEAVAVAAVEVTTVVATTPTPDSGATATLVIELGSVVPFSIMQAAVSKIMVESLSVPTFRVWYTITTDALDALYKKIKTKGVTMIALLAKVTALALAKHAVVNSSCRDGNSFTYNSSINIAVAVALDGGLITPVLQDVDKRELVDKAKAKQLVLYLAISPDGQSIGKMFYFMLTQVYTILFSISSKNLIYQTTTPMYTMVSGFQIPSILHSFQKSCLPNNHISYFDHMVQI